MEGPSSVNSVTNCLYFHALRQHKTVKKVFLPAQQIITVKVSSTKSILGVFGGAVFISANTRSFSTWKSRQDFFEYRKESFNVKTVDEILTSLRFEPKVHLAVFFLNKTQDSKLRDFFEPFIEIVNADSVKELHGKLWGRVLFLRNG